MIKNVNFHIERIGESSPTNPKQDETEMKTNREALSTLRNLISRHANTYRRLSLQD